MKKEILIVLDGKDVDVEDIVSSVETKLLAHVSVCNLDGFRYEKRDRESRPSGTGPQIPGFLGSYANGAAHIRKGARRNG